MDITAQQLRDIHPHEAFRGYQRDEVDALLHRAAVTIDQLEREVRSLRKRSSKVTAGSIDDPTVDADMIHRTLILAQRTADKAVAEAETYAQQLRSDSETTARTLVEEAEAEARRVTESERRRLEAEIDSLTSTRDALSQDVDLLEGFAGEYRSHIQRAIDAEVERLHASAVAVEPPGPRPHLETEETVGS